ncbi:hypothetical protein FHW03_001716 [Ochrobactrum sp. RH2CCR150]|nr:hypothetical protein [Ochrobactrum sp. RH2CCR150]
MRERESHEIAKAGRVAANISGPDDVLGGELFDGP